MGHSEIPMADLQDRVPPHNEEAEMAVLGAMMLSATAVQEVSQVLEPHHFYLPVHQEIYATMIELVRRRMTVDLVTMRDTLMSNGRLEDIGGVSYLVRLVDDVPSAASAVDYARIVRDRSKLRRLLEASAEIHKVVFDPNSSIDKKVETAEKLVYDLKAGDRADYFQPLSMFANRFFDGIEALMSNTGGVAGLTTGYPDLDRLTTGFSPGDLIILAARPAMGKTSLVMNFAMNVARSGNGAVACFNLEMPGEQLVQRLISMLSTVPIESMRRTGLSTESYDKIIVAAEQLVSLPIFIDDTSQLSALDMIARCRRLQMDLDDRVRRGELEPQAGRLALVIVDYLQLMRAQRGSDNRVQEVSEIARGLKLMARELRVPVIALSQLSREVEKRPNKRPQLSDLRESGSIEADADLVAFIYRDEYYRQKEEGGGDDFHENPEHTEASEVIIAKHRNGATGTVLLGFQPSLTRFWSLANEDKEDYWRSKRRQNFADD